MGAALFGAPYFSSIALAAQALLHSDDEAAKSEFLPALADGSALATVIGAGDGAPTLRATWRESGWSIDGVAPMVLDGHVADLVLVEIRDEGSSLFALDTATSGLTRTLIATLDQTRKMARLDFAGVEARLIGARGEAASGLARAFELGAIALAAEQLGGAQRVLDLSVAYAKDRFQFGRAIGSFQAIKHICADVLVEVESARSAVYYAAWVAANEASEIPAVASLAKAYCSDMFVHAAQQAVQVHGGIGFTWEHPVHLYLKRAVSSRSLLGDPSRHRELLAQHIGL
jgi:alkylation response protein AidB-like acyl-CoA dehydrogenase